MVTKGLVLFCAPHDSFLKAIQDRAKLSKEISRSYMESSRWPQSTGLHRAWDLVLTGEQANLRTPVQTCFQFRLMPCSLKCLVGSRQESESRCVQPSQKQDSSLKDAWH